MKTDVFPSCAHCWVFQICWYIECSTFTAPSFRILNSSSGMTSPPVVLFVVMLPKVHLTSYSRMSGSRWVTTPLWLSGSLRHSLYSSSVYSRHLFLISSAFVRSLPFLSFIVPIFAWQSWLKTQHSNNEDHGIWSHHFLANSWRNNGMGKTRDLFKKIRDTKRTFQAKMGAIKDRNYMDLTEAEEIKKRWQEYTEELYKKVLVTQITAMVWSLT